MPVYIFPSFRVDIAQLIRAESNHRAVFFMQTRHEFDLIALHGRDPKRYAADVCPPWSRKFGKGMQGIRVDDGPDHIRHEEDKQGPYGRAGQKPFSGCQAHAVGVKKALPETEEGRLWKGRRHLNYLGILNKNSMRNIHGCWRGGIYTRHLLRFKRLRSRQGLLDCRVPPYPRVSISEPCPIID